MKLPRSATALQAALFPPAGLLLLVLVPRQVARRPLSLQDSLCSSPLILLVLHDTLQEAEGS